MPTASATSPGVCACGIQTVRLLFILSAARTESSNMQEQCKNKISRKSRWVDGKTQSLKCLCNLVTKRELVCKCTCTRIFRDYNLGMTTELGDRPVGLVLGLSVALQDPLPYVLRAVYTISLQLEETALQPFRVHLLSRFTQTFR